MIGGSAYPCLLRPLLLLPQSGGFVLTDVIDCPNCSARYVVPQAMFPAPGRTVRCHTCGHSWFELSARGAEEHLETVPPGPTPGTDAPARSLGPLERVRRLLRDERGGYDAFAHRPPFQPRGTPYRLILVVAGFPIIAGLAVYLLWKLF